MSANVLFIRLLDTDGLFNSRVNVYGASIPFLREPQSLRVGLGDHVPSWRRERLPDLGSKDGNVPALPAVGP